MGAEYDSWLASYDQKPHQGLRINTGKLTCEAWESMAPFEERHVPWSPNGYYVPEDVRPAKDAWYYAGLYYLQEPSAMAPAAVLPVKPGDAVLDLCAAPGGKSTELGARLQGEGILVSNDISNSRARALLKNLELFGVPNICVTSEAPEKLADVFGAFFDKILVDAPCSGEGMFRKDPDLIKSWIQHGPEFYAPIQREILSQAVRMLKPGGYLLYSTCTFAKVEDEDTIDWILNQEPEMELVPITPWEGACGGVDGKPVIRLFPHRIEGEGHFLALLKKKLAAEALDVPGEVCGKALEKASEKAFEKASGKSGRGTADVPVGNTKGMKKQLESLEKDTDYLSWEQMLGTPLDRSRMMIKDDVVYYLPEAFDGRWKLRYLRTGLMVGECKKNRFEPAQAMAMTLRAEDYKETLNLPHEDERVIRYLKGETIQLSADEMLKKGWVLVCVDGFALGWAKCTGTSLKNKYYPGWRWQ